MPNNKKIGLDDAVKATLWKQPTDTVLVANTYVFLLASVLTIHQIFVQVTGGAFSRHFPLPATTDASFVGTLQHTLYRTLSQNHPAGQKEKAIFRPPISISCISTGELKENTHTHTHYGHFLTSRQKK